jgi:hypothetical protein
VSTQTTESAEAIRRQLIHETSSLVEGVQRCYRSRAILLWIASVLALLIAFVALDILIRREETGLRFLFSIVVLVGAATLAWYWILPAWRLMPTRVDVARWIERAQPELGERLSTAVQLAEAPFEDLRFGSIAFREAALQGWSNFASNVRWRTYLNHASWIGPATLLVTLLVALLGFTITKPAEVRLALARLIQPWSALPWPQQDQLQFVGLPRVIALGQELQLEVIDRVPPLPESIDIYVRSPISSSNKTLETISYPAKRLGESAVLSLPNIERAIELRAVGGDDTTMLWQKVDVTQAPKLASFRFQIQPPAYSGRSESEIVGNRIQVLAGSRVKMLGTFADPVARVEAVQQRSSTLPSAASDSSTPAASKTTNNELLLEKDQQTFSMIACDEKATNGTISWRLKITTIEKVTIDSPETWTIEVVADAPPKVSLQEQELTQITTDAYIPLRGGAIDDLGLSEIALFWQLEKSISESTPDGLPTAEPGNLTFLQESDVKVTTREFSLEHRWQLSKNLSLIAGQRWNIWLEAKDTLGQVGKSSVQTLEVRDTKDVLESITAKQAQLLEQVRAMTESQRRNSQLTSRSKDIILQSDSVRTEEVDALSNITQMQQALNRQLNADGSSVADSLERLSRTLENNGLGDSQLASQVKDLERMVDRIAKDNLAPALDNAQTAFMAAKQESSNGGTPTSKLKESLQAADQSQNEALNALQGLTDSLAQSETLRLVERELSQVLNQQQSLRRDTDNLELRRLAGMNKEEFQAERAGLQADQQGLAQTIDQLQRRAKSLIESMPPEQQAVQSQVERGLQTLIEEQVSSQMRNASESIGDDRFAEAARTQQAVSESLREALQQLSTSGDRNIEGQLAQQMAGSQELEQLAQSQSQLADALRRSDAARRASELSKQQRQIQQATEEQQSRAAQTGDSRTEKSLSDATQSQSSAAQSVESGRLNQAADQARQAAEKLKSAVKESQQRTKQLQREVAQQQMMQLEAALSQLVAQQQPIVEKLTESSQVQIAQLPAEERQVVEQSVRQLSSRQEAVRQMVRDVRERADKLPAFDWTLEQAEIDMARAVAATERFRLTPDAVSAAQRALKKLEQAALAIQKRENPDNGRESDDQKPTEDKEEKKDTAQPIPPLASLKLLRSLQADINEETKLLSTTEGTISESERARKIEQLSLEQQALGLQLEQILRELAASMDTNQ